MPPLELTYGDWNTDTATSTNINIQGDTFTLATQIPDSAFAHYPADGLSTADGNILDPYPDAIGSLDLSASGNPLYRTNSQNGLATVELDGTDDTYRSPTFTAVSQPFTIFVVCKMNSTSDDDRIIDTKGLTGGRIYFRQNSGSWEWFAGSFNTISYGSSDTNWHIHTLYADGSNSFARVDGTQYSLDIGSNGFEILHFGSDSSASDFYADMNVAEIVPCSAGLSTSDIESEEQRLSDKWGITI